jgi:hypothetical protein
MWVALSPSCTKATRARPTCDNLSFPLSWFGVMSGAHVCRDSEQCVCVCASVCVCVCGHTPSVLGYIPDSVATQHAHKRFVTCVYGCVDTWVRVVIYLVGGVGYCSSPYLAQWVSCPTGQFAHLQCLRPLTRALSPARDGTTPQEISLFAHVLCAESVCWSQTHWQ